jgi:hypothetical protein
MSQQLFDILTVELEYQQSIMRVHRFSHGMHRFDVEGYDNGYNMYCEANDKVRLIRQQMETIMRAI